LAAFYFWLGNRLCVGGYYWPGGISVRKFVVGVVLLAMCSTSFAQVTAFSRMQKTLSALVVSKMASRGFAANDPRWVGTLGGASGALGAVAATAVTVSAGAATAPAWITAGIALGMGYAVTLAADGLINWIFGTDGTVSTPGTASPYSVAGGYAPMSMYQVGTSLYATLDGACSGYSATLGPGVDSYGYSYVASAVMSSGQCITERTYSNGNVLVTGTVTFARVTGCAGVSLSAVNNVCPPSNFPNVGVQKYASPSAAVAALSPTDQAKPVSPSVLADFANRAWAQAAAAPGYSGVPYDAANPITQADVQAYQSANSSSYPTVGDLVLPQAAPSGGSVATPFVLPDTASDGSVVTPATQTNPSSQPLTNLGPDPGIGLPTLEATPTVSQILDPIFNLFPSLRSFTVPKHNATCPTATLNLFGNVQKFEAHCGVLEGVRPLLTAIMAFVWGFVALRITLSA
jgi:hypothetical protein